MTFLPHYARIIHGLHAHWSPHPGQIEIGKSLFGRGVREIFAECGRNFGKTDFMAYAFWRNAMMRPGSPNYYFAPYQKQAREIIWAPSRIQTFGPSDWIESINNTEMRITFKNGSFIKVDGSDNTEAYRGVKINKGGLIGYDEFKDFRPEFHIAMEPNLINAYLIIIGTPPEIDGQFTETADEFVRNPEKEYFNFPTKTNPHISTKWLASKRAELYAKGEGDVWEREYMARRVKGGKKSIFPMIHNYPITPHEQVMRELARDKKKLQWFCIADPAAISVFGVLYVALNPYTKKVYFLDEIYETDQAKMTVSQIGQRIIQMEDELHDSDEFTDVYDEAEAWFYNEMAERFSKYFVPTAKAAMDKDSGLSLIKDLLLRNLAVFSDRCKKLVWEMENYIKDDKGKVPKKNDHLIDCARYFLHAAQYVLESSVEPLPEHKREDFRGAKIEDDFPDIRGNDYDLVMLD